jgi:hypothetical protein
VTTFSLKLSPIPVCHFRSLTAATGRCRHQNYEADRVAGEINWIAASRDSLCHVSGLLQCGDGGPAIISLSGASRLTC